MSNQLQYTIMGDDGKEYGPVTADQIREWVRENRLEPKTPIKPDKAKDWVFLEMLPEFKDVLSSVTREAPGKRFSRKGLIALIIVVLAGIVWLLLKKLNFIP